MSRGSLTELRNGRIYDPLQGIDGEVQCIVVEKETGISRMRKM